MSYEIPGYNIGTLVAAADLSTKQFTFVKLNSSGEVAAVSSATDDAIGILQNKPDAQGKPCDVMAIGISKLVSGGTIAAGAKVRTTAAGKAVAAATTEMFTAQVLEGGAADEKLVVFVNCGGGRIP